MLGSSHMRNPKDKYIKKQNEGEIKENKERDLRQTGRARRRGRGREEVRGAVCPLGIPTVGVPAIGIPTPTAEGALHPKPCPDKHISKRRAISCEAHNNGISPVKKLKEKYFK